jgi:hypothetical protein
MHSEDGTRSEQTDMASLIDPNGPDDVASLDERESSGYDDENGVDEEVQSEVSELPQAFLTGEPSRVDDSNLTMKAGLQQSSESIEFLEPDQWPELERVELKHTIHILDEDEASGFRTQLPTKFEHGHLAITVQQTMTKQGLDLDKPFRVLYVGNPGFRNIVLDKIGDVLVSNSTDSLGSSSTESSRYHVVPTSFGVGATPNYAELLPIHVQLVVDECVDAIADSQAMKPSNITLKFKNRPPCASTWNGSHYDLHSPTEWTLPDLSIFFISDKDSDAMIRTRHLAHAFMKTHGIPVMAISEEPLWKKATTGTFPLDYQSLHVCLESRRPLSGETAVLRRYPIDMKTFESITPGQLNRHLASLSGLHQKTLSSVTPALKSAPDANAFYDSEKYPKSTIFATYTERAHEFAPLLRLIMLSIVMAISVSLGFTAVRAFSALVAQLFARSSMSNLATAVPDSTTTTAIIPPTEVVRPASLAITTPGTELSQRFESLSVSTLDDLAGISHILSEEKAKMDTFQFQVIGDCHVIIKQPAMKKQPKFNVSVTRGEQTLPYELSKLFDGVYTLRLKREDAYGLVNVTVKISSKTPREQTLEVDFGRPWLKIENWKRAAQAVSAHIMRDFGHAQTGVSEIYGRLSTDVEVWMGDVVKRSHALRREAESFRPDPVQLRETRDVVIAKSKELTEVAKHTAVQQFTAAKVALGKMQKQSQIVHKGAHDFMSNALSSIASRKGTLKSFKERLQNVKPLDSLARAQKAAKQLTEQTFRRKDSKSDHQRRNSRGQR